MALLTHAILHGIVGSSLLSNHGIVDVTRLGLRQIQHFPSALQTLKAKCKAKSVKEPLFKSYEQDLEKMISGLNSFLMSAGETCANAEATETDVEDDVLQAMEKQIQSVLNQCDHHAAGCKAAKTRFQTMLG